MSNETSGNGGKIIIGLLAIALIGSWIYFSTSKTEIITNYTTQVNNLDSAKNAIQADFIAVSAKADSLTQQNTQLQGDLLSKSNDIQQLKSNISNILRKKEATDKELAEAKSMIAELNGKVAGLFSDLAKAQEENKVLTVKNEVLTTENTNLNTNLNSTTKEKERLQDLGSTLHACKVEPKSCNLSFSFVVEFRLVFRFVFSVVNTSFLTVNTLFSSCAFAKSENKPATLPFNSAIIDLASANSLSVASFLRKILLIFDFSC